MRFTWVKVLCCSDAFLIIPAGLVGAKLASLLRKEQCGKDFNYFRNPTGGFLKISIYCREGKRLDALNRNTSIATPADKWGVTRLDLDRRLL